LARRLDFVGLHLSSARVAEIEATTDSEAAFHGFRASAERLRATTGASSILMNAKKVASQLWEM
jgi:hypothetical protein